MTDDKDSLDLTDRQKTRLLSLALRPPDPSEPRNEDDDRGDLLHDILQCSLPLQAATGACQGLRSVAGPPIGELLQDPKTSVTALKEVKQYAKKRGNHAASESEKDVFLAVYFAAIAAALVCHRERITVHSGTNSAKFLASFASAAWVPVSLRELFLKAGDCCKGREHPET